MAKACTVRAPTPGVSSSSGKSLGPRSAAADTPRTFLGYSVCHWEGNTLVVFTDHFNDRTQIDEEGLSHGLKLTVTERITKETNKPDKVDPTGRLDRVVDRWYRFEGNVSQTSVGILHTVS